MPECKRERVRADLDAVFYTREDGDDTSKEPGWYLERTERVAVGGPYTSQREAVHMAQHVPVGPTIRGGGDGLRH